MADATYTSTNFNEVRREHGDYWFGITGDHYYQAGSDVCADIGSGCDLQPPPSPSPPTIVTPLMQSGMQYTYNQQSTTNCNYYNAAVGVEPENTSSFGLESLEMIMNIGRDSFIKLSVGEILRLAADMYIQLSARKVFDDFTSLLNQYNNISAEDKAEIELIQLLLTAAESVGHGHYGLASLLIGRCQWMASDSGNAVQRLVFQFSKALQQRIDMETGRTPAERIHQQTMHVKRLSHDFNISFMEYHQKVPVSQAMQFAAIEAIIDHVKTAKKIHVVDIHICSGIQWTILMQVLAEREELPRLKISALATTNQQHVLEASKRLHSFAQSLNLPFTFNVIPISDMKQLRHGMFKRESDEVVVVYASIILRTMISNPKSLEYLMKRIKRLKPSIMVVTEIEASHNSTSFITRFTESLFFYGAHFDSLADCMDKDSKNRKILEGIYFGEGIKNIVASEGEKRCIRSVKMDVWREFFESYRMQEVQLSKDAMCQANMVVEKFSTGKSCTITSNGKGILIRWKGTPIQSLSSWKFTKNL